MCQRENKDGECQNMVYPMNLFFPVYLTIFFKLIPELLDTNKSKYLFFMVSPYVGRLLSYQIDVICWESIRRGVADVVVFVKISEKGSRTLGHTQYTRINLARLERSTATYKKVACDNSNKLLLASFKPKRKLLEFFSGGSRSVFLDQQTTLGAGYEQQTTQVKCFD